MINITDKTKCCGCTACYSACPKKCITMQEDTEGFLYPIVNKTECINCGLCEKVCPIISGFDVQKQLSAYAVQHNEESVLYGSAAGGAFSALAAVVLEQGGVAFGAAYDNKMKVYHTVAEKIEELFVFRSSKYVQSDQDDCFLKVKDYLDNGRYVVYSGTPCQISGLKNYLKKDYEKLLTVDLVCKGVASPKVLKQYVTLMEKKYNSRIVGMNFKRKTYGYHSSTMSVDFENGKSYSKGGITDPMMRSFRANICLRPSCAQCNFKGEHRASDITIFDCWHYQNLTGKKDNDKGHTSVLVHSEKGRMYLKKAEKYILIDKIDAGKAIELDGIMVCNCVADHKKREAYMSILNEKGLLAAINACIPVKPDEKFKDFSKSILYKLGLLKLVKKITSRSEIK